MPHHKNARKPAKLAARHVNKRAKGGDRLAVRVSIARRPVLHPLHIGITAALLIAVGIGLLLTGFEKPQKGTAANCVISEKLVNSCRPWLSAAAGGYPMVGSDQQFSFFNKRLNNPNALTNSSINPTLTYKVDVPHVYHTAGQTLFNGAASKALSDTALYGSANNPVLVNWKPGGNWGDAAKGSADASIIASAKAVKALGSRKIFLTLWHEPENDNVSAAGLTITGNCKTPTGTSGSAADYRAMWKHVRQLFDQQGVTNVVWFWNLTGFVGDNGTAGWACIVKDLYPGNEYVDWIMWDPYAPGGDFVSSISRFYNYLKTNSDAAHNFNAKPWGVAEHGSNSSPSQAAGYWQQGKEAIGSSWATNKFPNIKLWSVFDTSNNGGTNGGLRVGYNVDGGIDVNEQSAYNAFAQNILKFSDTSGSPAPTPTPGKDTAPPAVSLTSPADGSRHAGTITVSGTATDNDKVTAVSLRVDDKWVETDGSSPYGFKLDTTKYKDGKHNLVLRAWDPANNMGESKIVTITIDNHKSGTKADTTPAPKPTSSVIDASTESTADNPIQATPTLIISPVVAGNSLEVWVDGKLQPINVVDTTRLTNGVHTVKISENGQISYKLVSVKNPLPVAALNNAQANATSYSLIVVGVVVLAAVFGRTYILSPISWRESKLVRVQRSFRQKK